MKKELVIGKTYKVKSYSQLCEEYELYRNVCEFEMYKQKFKAIADKFVTITKLVTDRAIYVDALRNIYHPYGTNELGFRVVYAFEVEEIMEQEVINIF